ncbi:hypothetical protein L6452_43304 [Arctium lappa]|uniref:Uncharacterized protein n=1 Tax=Arctium lappa TaxID=4217 RepID=A0ACB8XL87_ARCLA|nr:hypothetical protein L6452_43304 [Arctium lappa]
MISCTYARCCGIFFTSISVEDMILHAAHLRAPLLKFKQFGGNEMVAAACIQITCKVSRASLLLLVLAYH